MGIATLDDGFPEHRKVSGLHDRAFRFHVTALCYCARNLTDGHVDAKAVKVIAAVLETQPKRWVQELVTAGLWQHDELGDGFQINDYLKHNPTAEALRRKRDMARSKGLKGAEARWAKHDAPGDSPGHSRSHSRGQSLQHESGQMPAVQNSSVQDQGLSLPLPHLRPVEKPLLGEIGETA